MLVMLRMAVNQMNQCTERARESIYYWILFKSNRKTVIFYIATDYLSHAGTNSVNQVFFILFQEQSIRDLLTSTLSRRLYAEDTLITSCCNILFCIIYLGVTCCKYSL